MQETDLPVGVQYFLIALQIFALGVFLYFVWPLVKSEKWKEKFIDNKTARSIVIVFVLIFLFVYGIGFVFDTFFPVQTID